MSERTFEPIVKIFAIKDRSKDGYNTKQLVINHESREIRIENFKDDETIVLSFEQIQDILAICNAAVHGREVSEKQVDFVIKNGKLI